MFAPQLVQMNPRFSSSRAIVDSLDLSSKGVGFRLFFSHAIAQFADETKRFRPIALVAIPGLIVSVTHSPPCRRRLLPVPASGAQGMRSPIRTTPSFVRLNWAL